MRKMILILAAFAAPSLALGQNVTPEANVEALAHQRALHATIQTQEGGMDIHGGFCRSSSFAPRIQNIAIEKIDTSGAVKERKVVRLFGATGNRSRGCAYYATRAPWTLSAGDTIRIGHSVDGKS